MGTARALVVGSGSWLERKSESRHPVVVVVVVIVVVGVLYIPSMQLQGLKARSLVGRHDSMRCDATIDSIIIGNPRTNHSLK